MNLPAKGRDFRYDGHGLVGSSLVDEGTVVHAAFFADRGGEGSGRGASARQMSRASQRRKFRRKDPGDTGDA